MTRALVIGANGQDGSFLVKHLLDKKYHVLAVGRQEGARYREDSPLFEYFQADLKKSNVLSKPLNQFKPDFVFHVAAVHTSAGGVYENQFDDVLKVNVGSVHTILEYLRRNPGSRFIYASSAKVFGDPPPRHINELTPRKNQCLYSISKNSAYNVIEYYREKHAVRASVVFLFNHESKLRPKSFFIPTILNCLSSALRNTNHITEINTLNFNCDWGSAEEYMDIVIDVIEKAISEDFVLGRGVCTYARDLVFNIFNDFGLNYKNHLRERVNPNSPHNAPYKVDTTKLVKHVGRKPEVDIYEVCKEIIGAERD